MKHGSDWYKREPNAYLGGVQGMTAKEHAVYSVVLDLIYVHGGSVNDDPRWIAGWISDMGAAAVRKAIATLIERGKLEREGDQLTQRRAKSEAKTKENLRETREKHGKNGGIASGVSRRTSSENSKLSEADASPREEKRREELGDGGGSAPAREPDPPEPRKPSPSPADATFRERILAAIGADPISGMIGPNGKRFGTSADMIRAAKWRDDFGFSEDDIVAHIADITADRNAKGTGPPGSWAYYESALSRLKTERAVAAMVAPQTSTTAPQGARHARRPDRNDRSAEVEFRQRVRRGEVDLGFDRSRPPGG